MTSQFATLLKLRNKAKMKCGRLSGVASAAGPGP
jgi:hypothetical protein